MDEVLRRLGAASTSLTEPFAILLKSISDPMDSLALLEQEALSSLSYPPVLYYVIIDLLGAQWTDRQYALAKVAVLVERVECDLRRMASLASDSRHIFEGMSKRLDVSKLHEIRQLGRERAEAISLLSQIDCATWMWANHVICIGSHILWRNDVRFIRVCDLERET